MIILKFMYITHSIVLPWYKTQCLRTATADGQLVNEFFHVSAKGKNTSERAQYFKKTPRESAIAKLITDASSLHKSPYLEEVEGPRAVLSCKAYLTRT